MNYPEELRERYNEVMYDERDIIQKFLEKQHDLRYGRQRDSWHFEPAVQLLGHDGLILNVTDVRLSNDTFVVFGVKDPIEGLVEMECHQFAYGELGKIIEALPDVNQILIKNAVSDIACLCRECSVNLEENPFNTKINEKHTSIALVDYIDGRVVAYNHDGKVVSDEYTCDFLVGLRDHINIEVLHRSNEYKELMELLSLEENMGFECQNYGDATFVINGTDVTFDVSSVRREDKCNLVIYGNDIDADVCDGIELTEKDIRREYLVSIIKEIKRNKYHDIMDTYNGHNAELVSKINAAWKSDKYHNRFSEILLALLVRDHEEYIDKYCEIEDYSGDWAMEHAHEIMEGVCDDLDLECILNFIRYEE